MANKQRRTQKNGPHVTGGSTEARQTAVVVLQVMAGAIHPADAAAQLTINLPRYYTLEKRALEGMIVACEPRSKGPGPNPGREREALAKEIKRLENEVLRYQALARASQRSLGLKAVKAKPATSRKRRKPAVRALKVAQTLQEANDDNEA